MSIVAEIKQNSFQVRETCGLEIIVRTTDTLNKGDTIEIQFPNTWYVISGPSLTRNIQLDDPEAEHYITVEAIESNAKFEVEIKPRQLNYPEGTVRHGRLINGKIVKGEIPALSPIRIRYKNTYAPYLAETEIIWIRVKGKAPDVDPILTVMSGPAVYRRIIVPSGVEPGEEFDILIVSLDEFDNLSSTQYKNQTLLTSEGKIVEENLDFIGSIRVPVVIEKEGVYRFKMDDILSNAVHVRKGCRGPCWGDIHIHTKLSHDGQGTDPYKYARDVSGLDIAGVMDHWNSLGEVGYCQILEWAREAYVPGKFVTLLGDERNPKILTGDHNIYIRNEEHFLQYAARPGNEPFDNPNETEDTLKALDPSVAMLVPHHTGLAWRRLPNEGVGRAIDINAYNDQGLRPIIEIYSHHGQSEVYNPQHILSYEFNRMRNPERRSNVSVPGPYYAQDYWMSGHRLGVIASSDEHSGQGGRRHGGIAAVWSNELTRASIFDALRNRQCYATTGERILIDFSVDDAKMGCCGKKEKGKVLPIKLKVWGTELLLRVEILRFRFGMDSSFKTILSESPRPETMDALYEIEDGFTCNCMYYARITQEPLEWPGMAWTSPVWIDAEVA